MDRLTKKKRSWNMSRIRGENTRPEMLIRSALHSMGYRFRLHVRTLPGRPDIVLPKLKTAIFVHGCFWHRHPHCKYAYNPKSRVDFWQTKFRQNVERDHAAIEKLQALGWKVKIIWECQVPEFISCPEKLDQIIRG